MDMTPEQYRCLLRNDFYTFMHRSFLELNPSATFLSNWHLEVICAKLEAARRGEIKRLIINLPPRGAKSHCASIALPAFWHGHDPSAQILCVSYSQELAEKFSRETRNIMRKDWYEAIFNTRLAPDRQAVHDFATTAQGFRMATSMGGVMTGRGADVIIIDDPMKPDEALSDVERLAVLERYDSTLYSRLNNKVDGVIIIVMQRLHLDDLVGHVLNKEKWEVLSFPAIAEEESRYTFETLTGPTEYYRNAGEVLHPAREPMHILDNLKATMGEYLFSAQYQQAPVPRGGGMIKAHWFKYYESGDRPVTFDRVIQSWDTANKSSELSDYSVCTTWGVKDKQIYLLNVYRKRMGYPELKRAVRDQIQLFKPNDVLIEDKASGTQLFQDLKSEGVYFLRAVAANTDKIMRMDSQTAVIENGFVHLPRDAHWLPDYVTEMTTFPRARHDDQVDSTAHALQWIKTAASRKVTVMPLRL